MAEGVCVKIGTVPNKDSHCRKTKNKLHTAEEFCDPQKTPFENRPIMKRPRPLNDGARFSGQLRHYHRSGVPARRTWDEWVEGEEAKPSIWLKCLKILGIVVALLALLAIIVGLVISLR
jgi:hypothetical protein